MPERRTTIWGWGYEDEQPTPDQQKSIAKALGQHFEQNRVRFAPDAQGRRAGIARPAHHPTSFP